MGHPGESIGDIKSQIDAKNIPLKIDVFFPDINEHPVNWLTYSIVTVSDSGTGYH